VCWKHVNGGDPDLPRPTREMLVDARRMGLVKRFDPWGSYIEPLFVHNCGNPSATGRSLAGILARAAGFRCGS
jgi:hypothetical protein